MQNNRRVVITGLGAVTPVGNTADETWRNLLVGKSGIGEITLFDPTEYAIKIAGEVKNFEPGEDIDAKEVRHMDRSVQFAVVASKQALRDAALEIPEEDSDRVGIIFGTGAGGRATTGRLRGLGETVKRATALRRGGNRSRGP